MKRNFLIAPMILAVGLAGCLQVTPSGKLTFKGKNKPAVEEPQPLLTVVDDVDLAKILVRPTTIPTIIEKDPFKPLQYQAPPGDVAVIPQEVPSDLVYLGVVTIAGETSALIRWETGKGVFKINDTIRDNKIIDIQTDFVVLEQGKNTYKIKRGVQ